MYVCRHQLLRAYVSTTSGAIRAAASVSVGHGRAISRRPSTHAASTSTIKRGVHEHNTSAVHTPHVLESYPVTPTSVAHSTTRPAENNGTAQETVLADPTLKVTDDMIKDIQRAIDAGRVDDVDALTARIFAPDSKWSNSDASVIREILDILLGNKRFYHRTSISRILQVLQSIHALDEVPLQQVNAIATRCLTQTTDPRVDTPTFTIVVSVLTDYILRVRSDPRFVEVGLAYNHATWLLFQGMMRLVLCKQYPDVLQTLRVLVDSGVIPAVALSGLNVTGGAFPSIVLMILVRTCVHFGFKRRAVVLLNCTIEWDKHMPAAFGDTINEVIEYLLDKNANSMHMQSAAGLIIRTMSLPHLSVRHRTLLEFYDRARDTDGLALAMAVYRVTRSKVVMSLHAYPPPNARNLFWLLRQCVENKNEHFVRLILTQVVEDNIELPPHSSAVFVKVAASYGLMSAARKMWQRAADAQNNAVIGDAGALVRLVSLVVSRIRHFERQAGLGLKPKTRPSRPSSPRPRVVPAVADASSPSATPPEAMFANLDPFSTDYDPHDLVEDDPHDLVEDDHQNLSYEARIDDYRAFADGVIASFVKSRQPLGQATHQELNALGRAYILVGQFVESIKVFKILLRRQELPDIYDANVALSMVAVGNPGGAADIIEQMIVRGMTPDKVTFGTVMHHALLQRDMGVVSRLCKRAREVGISALDFKTVGTQIRACVSNGEDGLTPRERVQKAGQLIDSVFDAGLVPSAGMGQDCVQAALGADDPVMAFRFWQAIVRDKVQWDDKEQAGVRKRIGRAVRRHWAKELVLTAAARMMLAELREPPLPANGQRTRTRAAKVDGRLGAGGKAPEE